jgi:hypothetical protein
MHVNGIIMSNKDQFSDTGKGIDKDLGEKLFSNTLLNNIKKIALVWG